MSGIGATEIILILLVVVLLFGAKKLPELARGSGRALRIFKAETKGLMDEDETGSDPHGRALPPGTREATTGVSETRDVSDTSTPDSRQP